MLWGNIIKAIPFVIQVILVVVAVALFAFFDPFGIFIQSRTKLKDTPVDVRSIREIGELITAEYYGEVIGSYAHEIAERQDTSRQFYHERMLELLNYYAQEISELHDLFNDKELKRKDIYNAYLNAFSGINNDPDYETLLYYMSNKSSFTTKNLDDRLKLSKKKNMVRNAVRNGIDESMRNSSLYLRRLFDVHEGTLQKERKKQLKKKNLVMLGRGWVKAGFDFGSFTEQNFKYDKENNNIYFIGFKPEILSATINPWFIPEEGVEGFEFLVVERKSRRDYKVVQLVKQRCLDELVRKAHEREIMLKAMENASESLREFFSLLIDEEINEVIFYNNELEYIYDEIIKNDTITGEELLLIDHLLSKEVIAGIDDEHTSNAKDVFIDSLKNTKAKTVIFDEVVGTGWSPELTIAYAVSKDGVFDEIRDVQYIKSRVSSYCLFTESLSAFEFTCSGQIDHFDQMADHINLYIGRSQDMRSMLSTDFESSELDTLFTLENQIAGIQVGKSDLAKFNALLLTQIKESCVECN